MFLRRLCLEGLESRSLLAGNTFYVDAAAGNDGNAGGEGAPWRTLQFAANRVVAGDTVVVRPGSYVGFDLRRDGTAAMPITFVVPGGGVAGGPAAVITTRNNVTPDGINLQGADYVVIDGFTIEAMPRAGIRSAVNHHAVIRNNVATGNTKWGIFSGFSDDLTIENNRTSGSIDEHGIYVSNSGDRPILRGNVSFGNRGNGIHMNGDLSQGGDGMISQALVENNVIYDNGLGGGSGINADGVSDSIFRNNLLYNNHASGISLYQIDGAAGSTNNLVVNNTIVQAANGRWALNIQDASTGNRVYNNILYNYHSFRGSIDIDPAALPGFVSDYNVVMQRFTTDGGDSRLTLAQWRTATGQDLHSIIATPTQLFVSEAASNYHLTAASPAVNVGTSTLAPVVDYEGTPRPSGTGFDIGADEFSPVDGTPPTVVDVRLRGSGWSAGSPAVVVPLPPGSEPLSPWSGIDVVQVTFSEDVSVAAGSVTLGTSTGATVGLTNFAYDAATRTASWRITALPSAARLTLAVDAALADLAGNVLAGGREFRWNQLTGDVNRDGRVDRGDVAAHAAAMFRRASDPGYQVTDDVNRDAVVQMLDAVVIRDQLGTTLPTASAPDAVGSPVGGNSSKIVSLRAVRSRVTIKRNA